MIRINREFCLTDNSVNCYGYRLLTEGLLLERFNPPVGFLMHDRAKGVAVQWTDIRIEGDAVYGTPIVNDTLFPELAKQIEEGFINAASVGHIVALELSENPNDIMPGQTGPTVTSWFPREISLVDIPGNFNALARLHDENDNILCDLSADINNNTNMNFKDIFPDLKSEAEEELRTFLQDLKARADKADSLQTQVDALNSELADLRASAIAKQVDDILSTAVAEHRISGQMSDQLRADYASAPDKLQALIAMMPKRNAVPTPTPRTDTAIENLSWDELDRNGQLQKLRTENPELYRRKFQERFGTQPNN